LLLFAVTRGLEAVDAGRLGAALGVAAEAFPQLDVTTLWTARSPSGRLAAAAIHHSPTVSRPRRYRAAQGNHVVLFDGLPLDRRCRFSGHDAGVLLDRWHQLAGNLEGQFVAVRVDMEHDDLECITDSLGIAPVYLYQRDGGWLLSNSVEAIRSATGADSPDPLGVSTFLSLGWAAGDRTLVHDIEALGGGHRYRVTSNGVVGNAYLSPRTVAHVSSRNDSTIDDVADELVNLTAAVAETSSPVSVGLTGGRDTRVLLALLRAAGVDRAEYYTIGDDDDSDVRLARNVAVELGVPYRVMEPSTTDASGDWMSLTKLFVSQSDGLSSLLQIGEYTDQLRHVDELAIKPSGLGGEIGRSGVGPVRFAGTVPLARSMPRVHRQVVRRLRPPFAQLLTAEALVTSTEYLHRFLDERREEGWPVPALSEVFYTWDRVARWGSAGFRRSSAAADLFSPFCSQAFITYSFSLSPSERYLEAAHYRLLSKLAPRLRDMPGQEEWAPQRPALAPALASRELLARLLERSIRRVPRRRASRRVGPAAPSGVPAASMSWFEDHLAAHREVCLSPADSPLWRWVDRRSLENILAADASERAPLTEGVVRVASLFWYFHGRHVL
jgi:asparagine synthase (glutamine-hydrolysing)